MRLPQTERLEQLARDLITQERRLSRAVREAERIYGARSESAQRFRRQRSGYRNAIAIVREELAALRGQVMP